MSLFSAAAAVRLVLFSCFIAKGKGLCYFPSAFHGVFLAQRSERFQTDYAEVVVAPATISLWGLCLHRHSANDFILEDNAGGAPCIRCARMHLRSPNVIQVYTESVDHSRCFVNMLDARDTCPSDADISSGNADEITLYRTNSGEFLEDAGKFAVKSTFCPFSGQFQFTYRSLSSSEQPSPIVHHHRQQQQQQQQQRMLHVAECNQALSIVGNCPFGFGLTFHYHGCSFPDKRDAYQCLGHWEGTNGHNYFALMDMEATSDSSRPKYRCGMYREDPETGTLTMSMAADSNCKNRLNSPEDGAETWMLNPVLDRKPAPALVQESSCEFPTWARGVWEDMNFGDTSFSFREHEEFHTYKATCVSEYLSDSGEEKFNIYAKSQCGKEMYACLWLIKRGINVMEYHLSPPTKEINWTACAGTGIKPESSGYWSTQGRKEVLEESPCPITGEYTGLIPDASGLCARLFSDCENPESMHYKVYNCYNASDVYEDRRYKCLGQWEENSVMYTYTERTDVPGHECFLGRIVNDQELFIQEAGVNCQRPTSSLHSVTHGMKLLKKASCYAKRPAVIAEGPPAIPAVPRHSWTPKYPQIVHTTPPPQLRNWQPTVYKTSGQSITTVSSHCLALLCLIMVFHL